MVGRSKPQKNMEPNPSDDFPAAEIAFLKAKNNELAKALSDTKVSMKQTVDERDFLQKQVLMLHMRNSELLNYIKHIDQAARKSINAIVLSSNYITEIAQITMASIQKGDTNSTLLNNSLGNTNVFTPSSCKMRAVKPMIDGHVIHRPFISLRRVNEVPMEEIQSSRSPQQASRSNLSMEQEDNTENSSFRRRSAATANTRSFNDLSHHTPIDGLGNEEEDEFMDQSSSISENERVINSRLPTIEELSEAMDNSPRSEDDLSTIANASTSSIGIPGSSQGPLLSGVFKDVRVYLSPMQNVSQYLKSLESLQGVTTERGKLYTSKKVGKKQYSPRTVSLDENNQCVVTLKSPSTCLDQSNSVLSSANNSFDNPDSSILTSTRIGNNFEESCRPRSSNYVKKSRWSNNFENTTIDENIHMIGTSSESGFNESLKWIPKQNGLKSQHYKSSCHSATMTSTAYDPLEGPSTLLDSSGSIMKEKLETLSMLGLQPNNSNKSLPNTPSSPANAVLKRRERSRQDNSPIKKNISIYVTKRKLDAKKPVISTKLITRRKSSPLNVSHIKRSLSSSRESTTPKKRNSSSISPIKGKRVSFSFKKEDVTIKQESDTLNSSSATTSISTATSATSSTKVSRRKRNFNDVTGDVTRRKSKSPVKTPKQKRNRVKVQSLKEPSLRKKMRRS